MADAPLALVLLVLFLALVVPVYSMASIREEGVYRAPEAPRNASAVFSNGLEGSAVLVETGFTCAPTFTLRYY